MQTDYSDHCRRAAETGDMMKNRGFECAFDPCEKEAKAKGYCPAHYQQLRAGKQLRPLKPYKKEKTPCSFAECDRPARANGLCGSHYAQRMRGRRLTYIRPQDSRPGYGPKLASLPLTERLAASTKRDAVRGCLLWTRGTNSSGSGVLTIDGKPVTVTHAAFDLFFGTDIGGRHVMRACRNKLCIEPAHMYVHGLTAGWRALAEPHFDVIGIPGQAEGTSRLGFRINGTVVETSPDMTEYAVQHELAKIKGAKNPPKPEDNDLDHWLLMLTGRRRQGWPKVEAEVPH